MLDSLSETITVPSYAANKKLKSYSNSSLQWSMVYTLTKHKKVMCMQQ